MPGTAPQFVEQSLTEFIQYQFQPTKPTPQGGYPPLLQALEHHTLGWLCPSSKQRPLNCQSDCCLAPDHTQKFVCVPLFWGGTFYFGNISVLQKNYQNSPRNSYNLIHLFAFLPYLCSLFLSLSHLHLPSLPFKSNLEVWCPFPPEQSSGHFLGRHSLTSNSGNTIRKLSINITTIQFINCCPKCPYFFFPPESRIKAKIMHCIYVISIYFPLFWNVSVGSLCVS